ncbi:carcinoembryonic antigen-related cell adhesion molecule 1, partial [Xenopus tropicalis]|uniref:Carcinoembryonic antigen-related cell adhesion molecule 1 n=1 Tax=Xenopus tropicalis TaxID=8364 RepID=A0A8J0T4I4_XENTR
SSQGSPGGSLSAGAIAGIVIGSLAGVALIAVAVFFIVKSTKKKQRNENSRSAQMPMSAGVADKNKEDEEYVKYADLRFKNANPANKAPVQQAGETEYSTVKK